MPHPALAIIASIDNDIRCDGTDDQHIPEFGADIAEVLDYISAQSPNTKILLVTQAGRPDIGFVKELVAHDPSAKAGMTNPGNPCTFFDADGKIDRQGFATLTGIIEAMRPSRLASAPRCRTARPMVGLAPPTRTSWRTSLRTGRT